MRRSAGTLCALKQDPHTVPTERELVINISLSTHIMPRWGKDEILNKRSCSSGLEGHRFADIFQIFSIFIFLIDLLLPSRQSQVDLFLSIAKD